MAKQHTLNRRTGKTYCGREMPENHNEWSDLETCQRCADAQARETEAYYARKDK